MNSVSDTLVKVLLAACLWGSLGISLSQAQTFDDARYAVYRTWALAPPETEHGYKIVSFIPESYFLFLSDSDPVYVSGQAYQRALTQDGVEVIIHPEAISEESFQRSVGDHQVIFNSDYLMCKQIGCQPSLETDWLVARGEAYRIVSSSQSLITLRGTRSGQVVEGYVPRNELEYLTRIGKVTRADLPQPKYQIDKFTAAPLATSCGQTRDSGSALDLAESDEVARRILELIPVAKMAEDEGEEEGQYKVSSAYGGPGYANAFYLYRIRNYTSVLEENEGFFEVAAALKIDCTLYEDGSYTENFIQHMTLMNSKNVFNGRPIANEISMDLFDTPRDLRDYTGDAYMISVNKPEHFQRALEILTNRIGDRQLSGYILTELNRSCRSSMRNPYSGGPCVSYNY
jgi:hypothetical protein